MLAFLVGVMVDLLGGALADARLAGAHPVALGLAGGGLQLFLIRFLGHGAPFPVLLLDAAAMRGPARIPGSIGY
jgi:hypothetical protein